MTDYRVAPGEAQEDQVTASIEKFTSKVPSSIFPGGFHCFHSGFGELSGRGQEARGAVYRAVGRPIPVAGYLQQDGEAAWIGCDRQGRQPVDQASAGARPNIAKPPEGLFGGFAFVCRKQS